MATKLDTLFADLELRTKGWETGVDSVEKGSKKISEFIKENRLAAAVGLTGAFASAAIAVAFHAAKMADAVEISLRRIQLAIPGAEGRLKDLVAVVDQVSEKFGLRIKDVADAAVVAAQGGVASIEDVAQRLNIAGTAARASGLSITEVLNGLDQAMDLFGISTDHADEVLGKLFAAAKGRTSLQDLLQTLQTMAPIVNESEVSFNELIDAIVVLLDKGYRGRRIMSEFEEAALRSPTAIKEIGKAAKSDAAEGLEEMNKKAKEVEATLTYQEERLFSRYENALEHLGRSTKSVFARVFLSLNDTFDLVAKNAHVLQVSFEALAASNATSAEDLAKMASELNVISRRWSDVNIAQALQSVDQQSIGTLQNMLDLISKNVDKLAEMGIELHDDVAPNFARLKEEVKKYNDELERSSRVATENLILEGKLRNGKRVNPLDTPNTPRDVNAFSPEEAKKAIATASQSILELKARLTAAVDDDVEAAVKKLITDFDTTMSRLRGKQRAEFAALKKEAIALTRALAAKDAQDKLTADIESAQKNVEALFGPKVTGLVGGMSLAIAQLEASLVSAGKSFEEIDARLAPLRAAVATTAEATRVMAEAEQQLNQDVSDNAFLTAQQYEALKKLADQLRALQATLPKNSEAWLQVDTAIKSIDERLLSLAASMADADFGTPDMVDNWSAILDSVVGIGRGLVEGLQTLNLMDQKAASMATSLITGAESLGKFLASGNLADLGSFVSSALNVIGGLFGGGESPEAKAHRELLVQNNNALKDLAKAIGDSVRSIRGAEVSQSRTITAAVLRELNDPKYNNARKRIDKLDEALIDAQLNKLGTTFEEVQAIARKFGIELDKSKASFQQLSAVLKRNFIDEALKSFSGQQDIASIRKALAGGSSGNAAADLAETIRTTLKNAISAAASGGGNLEQFFGDALENLDPAALRDAMTQLFEGLLAGTIDPSVLGNLDIGELFGLLEDISGWLDQLKDLTEQADRDLQAALGRLADRSATSAQKLATAQAKLKAAQEAFDEAKAAGTLTADIVNAYLDALDAMDAIRDQIDTERQQFEADHQRFVDSTERLADLSRTTQEKLAVAQDKLAAAKLAYNQALAAGLLTPEIIDALYEATVNVNALQQEVISEIEDIAASAEEARRRVTRKLQTSFEIFSPDTLNRLSQFIETIAGLDGNIDLSNIDITTQAGRDLAVQLIRDFYATSENLTEDAVDNLLALLDLISSANDEAAASAQEAINAAQEQARLEAEIAEQRRRDAEAFLEAQHAEADRFLQQIRDSFEVFDITDPINQIQSLAAAFKKLSPVMSSLIGNLDLSTPEGRAALDEAIRDFFAKNPRGIQSGFLSADQTVQAIKDLETALDNISNGDITQSGGGSIGFTTSITAAQGDRIGALLGTGLMFQERTALATEYIAAILSQGQTLKPPTITTGGAVSPGTIMVNLYITPEGSAAPSVSPGIQDLARRVAREIANDAAILSVLRGG